jgi:hypothetical protein
MTFAGFHAHGSLGTVWKPLELDRRKCGLSHEKEQTEKRENKREWHGPLLLLNFIRRRLRLLQIKARRHRGFKRIL